MDLDKLSEQVSRRQQILDAGVGLQDLEEYQVLTLHIAQAAPGLLRAIKDVIALRDEMMAQRGVTWVDAVAHAFGHEIDRVLKGHRRHDHE